MKLQDAVCIGDFRCIIDEMRGARCHGRIIARRLNINLRLTTTYSPIDWQAVTIN